MHIVLGVGGGIAAYKVASLLRLFTEAGHDVTVIPTEAATRFVGVATWEALSGHPVSNSVFDEVHTVNHVRLGHEAELIVVAPATADLLANCSTIHRCNRIIARPPMASLFLANPGGRPEFLRLACSLRAARRSTRPRSRPSRPGARG